MKKICINFNNIRYYHGNKKSYKIFNAYDKFKKFYMRISKTMTKLLTMYNQLYSITELYFLPKKE